MGLMVEQIMGIGWCVACVGFAMWSLTEYIIDKNKKL